MKALKDKGITVKYDTDKKKRPGFKFAEYELHGIPVRIGIGKRDLEKGQIELARRDTGEKALVPVDAAANVIEQLLGEIQTNLFQKAVDYRTAHTSQADDFDKFKEILEDKGGFISAHWDGTTETEKKIKELTKATIRCIPLDNEKEEGKCILTGQPSKERVLFAKAY